MLKNFILLFGFSTFVTIVWIIATIHHNSVTSKISPVNKSRIAPIESSFDKKAIDGLKTKENIRANLSESANIITDPDSIVASKSSTIEIPTTTQTPTITPEDPL